MLSTLSVVWAVLIPLKYRVVNFVEVLMSHLLLIF